MDEYPQPRPVMYGTSKDEAPPQTQTLPVRSGPPRYPPAPPMAGDAPDPFQPSRSGRFVQRDEYRPPSIKFVPHLSMLYFFCLVYSLVQIVLGVDQILLLAEVLAGLVILASLQWLNGREYLVALGCLVVSIALGTLFAQWYSPAFWMAIVILLYLLKPKRWRYYTNLARFEMRPNRIRYKRWRSTRDRSIFRTARDLRDSPQHWR